MRRVIVGVLLCMVTVSTAACTGTPEARVAGWEDAGFRPPFSYENTRCFAACAEEIARMEAEEEARKRAEEEMAARAAAAKAAALRSASTKRKSTGTVSDPSVSPVVPRPLNYCAQCGQGTKSPLTSTGLCPSCWLELVRSYQP